MELWIRSQDKERLTTINDLRIYYASKEKVWVIVDCDDLAYYKTKERALEILDEIQKKINLINLGHDFGSPMIDLENPTYIYEMPKE